MKTQISELINGAKYIRRDESNSKYIGCPKATSHIGYAGTNSKLRGEVAANVLEENLDGMDVELFGKQFHLLRCSSLSGKTVWFETTISLEDYLLLSGFCHERFKADKEYLFTLQISNDMNVVLRKFSRANERATMKPKGFYYIDEAFVTIL